MPIAIAVTVAYLLGSIPFGLVIAKAWKGVDIRQHGSGNIGASNVTRVCGPNAGRVVLLLDILKGFLPPFLAERLFSIASPWTLLIALAAIVGHIYPIWLRFKGGKGIATSAGALFGAAPLAGAGVAVVFAICYFPTLYVSVASIAAAIALPFFMFFVYRGDYYMLAFGICASALAIYKHRKNISRIRSGTEPKTYLFRKKPTDTPTASTQNTKEPPDDEPR